MKSLIDVFSNYIEIEYNSLLEHYLHDLVFDCCDIVLLDTLEELCIIFTYEIVN